jgi:hypothetical protein
VRGHRSVAEAESAVIRDSFLKAARFVGREREFRHLSVALDDALTGRGGLWLVGGESGVGKSRLVNEIRHQAMVKGMLVLTGETVQDGAEPFQLWNGVVRRLLLHVPVDEIDAATLQLLIPDVPRILGREADGPATGELIEPLSTIIRRMFEMCTATDAAAAGRPAVGARGKPGCAGGGVRAGPRAAAAHHRRLPLGWAPGLLTRFPSARPLPA